VLAGKPVRQIAYYVEDIRAAATRHAEMFGSGPYFVMEFPPLTVIHRGKSTTFDQTAAVGQWNSLQVEFLQQNDSGPSVLHDLYPPGCGKTGLHHVAIFVDELNAAVESLKAAGHEEAARISPAGVDVTAVFVDTVSRYGRFIELYEPKPILTRLYDMVAAASRGFDGTRPIRSLRYDLEDGWAEGE